MPIPLQPSCPKEGKEDRLIVQPVAKPANTIELLTEWKKEDPLGPDDQFPDIEDMDAKPKNIF